MMMMMVIHNTGKNLVRLSMEDEVVCVATNFFWYYLSIVGGNGSILSTTHNINVDVIVSG